MKKIKILALTFLIISYLSLIAVFVFENELQDVEFPYFFIVWGLGILNSGFNIYYGIETKLKTWVLVILVISGLLWIFPPLLITYFGIPFLVIYLASCIYLHAQRRLALKVE